MMHNKNPFAIKAHVVEYRQHARKFYKRGHNRRIRAAAKRYIQRSE